MSYMSQPRRGFHGTDKGSYIAIKKTVYELFILRAGCFLWKKSTYQELEQMINRFFYIL